MAPPTKKAKKSTDDEKAVLKYAPNPHLRELSVDHLYHIGLDSGMDLRTLFGGVTHVAMGGSPSRMSAVANLLPAALGVEIPMGMSVSPIGKVRTWDHRTQTEALIDKRKHSHKQLSLSLSLSLSCVD
jgi:hypothetical protein